MSTTFITGVTGMSTTFILNIMKAESIKELVDGSFRVELGQGIAWEFSSPELRGRKILEAYVQLRLELKDEKNAKPSSTPKQ